MQNCTNFKTSETTLLVTESIFLKDFPKTFKNNLKNIEMVVLSFSKIDIIQRKIRIIKRLKGKKIRNYIIRHKIHIIRMCCTKRSSVAVQPTAVHWNLIIIRFSNSCKVIFHNHLQNRALQKWRNK